MNSRANKDIPAEVHGNPVKYYLPIDPPRYPSGYPGDGKLEKTAALLLSISDDDNDDRLFWITCIGVSGQIMAGDMYYTLEAAIQFPTIEFGLDDFTWVSIDKGGNVNNST